MTKLDAVGETKCGGVYTDITMFGIRSNYLAQPGPRAGTLAAHGLPYNCTPYIRVPTPKEREDIGRMKAHLKLKEAIDLRVRKGDREVNFKKGLSGVDSNPTPNLGIPFEHGAN